MRKKYWTARDTRGNPLCEESSGHRHPLKRHPKYRIRIEDESRLENLADIAMSPRALCALVCAAVALMLFLSGCLIMITPLHTLLPGYMKQTERSATEDNILRLDSILNVYEKNQEYIDNIFRAFDTGRIPGDSAAMTANVRELSPDSLLPPSPAEQRFVSDMEERERFNISVLAPLAADGMMFSPLCDGGIFLSSSREKENAEVIIPGGEAVRCVADGSILANYHSASEGGYVVIIQHAKGFVTRCSGLGTPMVSTGDAVLAGQIIALSPLPDASGKRTVEVMMWHNGLPIIPYRYIGNAGISMPKDEPFEAPRGR